MTNQPVIDGLKKVLASSYTLRLKTQNYHWNVTGPNFRALHLMFEEQYDDLAVAIDEIAERIRALGEKAPGNYKTFAELSVVDEATEDEASTDMLRKLAVDQALIADVCRETLERAEKAGDEVTLDMMVGRMTVHDKNKWMLESSL